MDIAQKTKNKGTQKIREYAEQSVLRCMRKNNIARKYKL